MLRQLGIFEDESIIAQNSDVALTTEDLELKHTLQKLYKLYSLIYISLKIDILNCNEAVFFKDIGIVAYPQDMQAELIGSELMDYKQKLKLHEMWYNKYVAK